VGVIESNSDAVRTKPTLGFLKAFKIRNFLAAATNFCCCA
jgi:hypothetical protein